MISACNRNLLRAQGSPRADLFRCQIVWKQDGTLYIGWGDSVQIGVIKERSKFDVASGLPGKVFDVLYQ